MVYGITFIVIFIIGFAFGIAMPFILSKFPYGKKQVVEQQKPQTDTNQILNEWLNGGE